MKKKAFKGVMLLVAAMIFSAGGTCFAQETVFVDPTLSGTTRLFYGPVFSTADRDDRAGIGSGATAYGIVADPFDQRGLTQIGGLGGATPFAIARNIKDAGGNMNLVWPADAFSVDFSGATATGSPAVISGKTSAFVVAVQAPFNTAVAEFDGPNLAQTGVTVIMFDGATMTGNWKRGIPQGPAAALDLNLFNPALPYFPTELTIWKPRKGSQLDDTGVTIYGTMGADRPTIVGGATTGASVWALTNWGAIAGGGTWDQGAGTTAWPVDGSAYSLTGSNTNILVGNRTVSPIDGFVASPVISGNSVFYVGYNQVAGGITVYQLDKDRLGDGVIYAATVRPTGADFSDRFMPTPVVSGGSLFVVCNQGGVTVYNTANLAFGATGGADATAGYLGNLLLPAGTFTGVTASPVTYSTEVDKDPYIIMCGTSAVTAWKVSDGLASVPTQRQWWYDFVPTVGANAEIIGTPAVAAGYLFVPVSDAVGNSGTIYAFKITDTPGANDILQPVDQFNLNSMVAGSPILVHRELWAFSYGRSKATNAQAFKWNVNHLLSSDDMRAHKYWTQFKFDAEKTGDATVQLDDDWYPEDSSGCFLSTIQ